MAKPRQPAAAVPEENGRRRGRPLDPSRDRPILETTLQLLEEVGFDRFRMQDVAEQAAVGLGTIYRRWPTKGDLIVAALKLATADVEENHTRDLKGLRGQLRDLASMMSIEQLDLLPGVIAAAHRDPEIAEAFRASWLDPRLTALRSTVDGAASGPLRPDLRDLLAEVGPALLMLRALVTHEPLDRTIVNRIVDEIVAPLIELHSRPADQAEEPGRPARRRSPQGSRRASAGGRSR